MEIEERTNDAPWRWTLLSSVVILNIFLPGVVLSYGSVFVHAVAAGSSPQLELVTPAVLSVVFWLTHCWCREAADSWGGQLGYRVMGSLGLMAVVAGITLCAVTSQIYHPLLYGALGGLGLSMIAAQVDAVVFETYDSRIGVVRSLCAFGQAIGQFVFPHIIMLLVQMYGASMFYLLFGGIMLQTLPAIMFLKTDTRVRRPASYSRYGDSAKTYTVFNNDTSNGYYTNELQLHDLSRKCWKSPSDDNLHREMDLEETDNQSVNIATVTPPPSPEEKRRNIFGVEILPEIPEESEVSDDSDIENSDRSRYKNKKRLSSAIRRLSTMGDSLDEYISKKLKDSLIESESEGREYTEIEVIYDNVSPMTEIKHEKLFNSFTFRCNSAYVNVKRKICIPSYRLYRIKRRTQYFFYSLKDIFIKPLTTSLSYWRFYPAMLLCFATLCLRLSMILLPIITLQVRPQISLTEMNFLMSLHSFTWICFLLGTPWVVQMSKSNIKYVVLVGLSVSATAFFVIAECHSHDSVSIGCVIAGFGFGALAFCWEGAAKEFVGARMWPKIISTMETISATLLAILVTGLVFLMRVEQGLEQCMLVLGIILAAVTTVWFVIAFITFCKSKMKNLRWTKSFWSN